jgi:hypothetical protein
MTQALTKTRLYEQDLNLWFEQTLDYLRSDDLRNLDIEALIEEIEGLAGRDRREIKSFLKLLFLHALKRRYVPSPETYNHWVSEIENFQSQLSEAIEQSPSLKRFLLDSIPEAYNKALAKVRKLYPNQIFPVKNPFSIDLEILLESPFWQT